MRFQNSMRLLMENFKNVYKLLLYKLIIALIASALCCAFILPDLMAIWNSEAIQTLVQHCKDFLQALLAAQQQDLETIKGLIIGEGGAVAQALSLIASKASGLIWSFIGCGAVYLLNRFADTICYFTMGCILNDRMATYAETPFFSVFISNLGKASAYAAVYVPTAFLFDVVTILLGWLWLSIFPILPALFAIFTTIALVQALKFSLTGHWMPAMIADNKPLGLALKYEDEREIKQFWKAFSNYLITVYLVIIVNVISAVCTMGSALLITVPACYFLYICLQFVNYYTVRGKKYFITYENIESNAACGDNEHFFEYVQEGEKQQAAIEETNAKTE